MKPKNNLHKTRCPRCGGRNLYPDSDEFGWFEHCLQCGYTGELETSQAVEWNSHEKEAASGINFDE